MTLEDKQEPTIEQALAELREMFPLATEKGKYSRKRGHSRPVLIECSDRVYSDSYGDSRRKAVKINISYAEGGFSAPLNVEAETLSEAMAQVRRWYAERRKMGHDSGKEVK